MDYKSFEMLKKKIFSKKVQDLMGNGIELEKKLKKKKIRRASADT